MHLKCIYNIHRITHQWLGVGTQMHYSAIHRMWKWILCLDPIRLKLCRFQTCSCQDSCFWRSKDGHLTTYELMILMNRYAYLLFNECTGGHRIELTTKSAGGQHWMEQFWAIIWLIAIVTYSEHFTTWLRHLQPQTTQKFSQILHKKYSSFAHCQNACSYCWNRRTFLITSYTVSHVSWTCSGRYSLWHSDRTISISRLSAAILSITLFLAKLVLQMVTAGNGRSVTGMRCEFNVTIVDVVHWIHRLMMNVPARYSASANAHTKNMLRQLRCY